MRRLVLASLCVSWMSACGSEGPAAIPLDDLADRVVDAVCNYSVRCGVYLDKATCSAAFGNDQQLQASVKAGKVKYDGRAAAACLEIYEAAGCKISDGSALAVAGAEACQDVVKGAVADGGVCINAGECVSNQCDRETCGNDTCCTGVCVASVSLGGACTTSFNRCAEGLFCKADAATGIARCEKPLPAGAECGSGDSCVAGTLCTTNAATAKSTCAKPPAEGQACLQEICDSGATDFCDRTTKTCVARIAVGGSCALGVECVPYATCDTNTMKCVPLKAAGAACTSSSECVSDCDNNVCTRRPDRAACP